VNSMEGFWSLLRSWLRVQPAERTLNLLIYMASDILSARNSLILRGANCLIKKR
jgi:hypothetical protein